MFLHPDRSIRSKTVSLGKQAKPLTKAQVEAVLGYLSKTRHPIRNRLMGRARCSGVFAGSNIFRACFDGFFQGTTTVRG
jgi:hypothetical protein